MKAAGCRRWFRRLLASLIGALASFVLFEAALRVLLFSDDPRVIELSGDLRSARNWANQRNDDLYWKLSFLWANPERRHPLPNVPDPLLGWLGAGITPGTYEHRAAARLESRRPVLLYGDSYAQGATGPEGTFATLMSRSALADTHGLLNYGVGGYGVDQAYLLCKRSIELYAERQPIVIFSILVDDDLDRASLSFRSWPKPRLRVSPGGLELTPPESSDAWDYLDAHPPAPLSWTWQYVLNSREILSRPLQARLRSDARHLREKQQLFVALMKDLQRDLDARGVEWFVLIFMARKQLIAPRPLSWREPFVVETLEQLGIPHVNTRRDLLAFMAEHGLRPKDLFIQKGHGRNHLNRLGNLAALESMLRGMRGEFDPYEYVPREL